MCVFCVHACMHTMYLLECVCVFVSLSVCVCVHVRVYNKTWELHCLDTFHKCSLIPSPPPPQLKLVKSSNEAVQHSLSHSQKAVEKLSQERSTMTAQLEQQAL